MKLQTKWNENVMTKCYEITENDEKSVVYLENLLFNFKNERKT